MNHLGSVLVTVSDRKYSKNIDANGHMDTFTRQTPLVRLTIPRSGWKW